MGGNPRTMAPPRIERRIFLALVFVLLLHAAIYPRPLCAAQGPSASEQLIRALELIEPKGSAGAIFQDQNKGKQEFITAMMSRRTRSEATVPVTAQTIEFFKINPTKYRLRVHKAGRDFPLIFSQTYHKGWEIYIVKKTAGYPLRLGGGVLAHLAGNRGTDTKNDEDRASWRELGEYALNGDISALGGETAGESRAGSGNAEPRTSGIDFISKNIRGSIQNDNLPEGRAWETWFPMKAKFMCPAEVLTNDCLKGPGTAWEVEDGINHGVFRWPDQLHWKVNGYANGWWIDIDLVRRLPRLTQVDNGFYVDNGDGTIDFEIVIEFWPQRLVYGGILISVATLVLTLLYFAYTGTRVSVAGKRG